MSSSSSLQQKIQTAFDNYLWLTLPLKDDVNDLLDVEQDTEPWRRNFIRTSVALIEGQIHCLRDICLTRLEFKGPQLAKNEIKALESEQQFDSDERYKYVVRAAYKLFELDPAPDFGGSEWRSAQRVFEKRHQLMHPKTPVDLEVSDELWEEIHKGVVWLIEHVLDFPALILEKNMADNLIEHDIDVLHLAPLPY